MQGSCSHDEEQEFPTVGTTVPLHGNARSHGRERQFLPKETRVPVRGNPSSRLRKRAFPWRGTAKSLISMV